MITSRIIASKLFVKRRRPKKHTNPEHKPAPKNWIMPLDYRENKEVTRYSMIEQKITNVFLGPQNK